MSTETRHPVSGGYGRAVDVVAGLLAVAGHTVTAPI